MPLTSLGKLLGVVGIVMLAAFSLGLGSRGQDEKAKPAAEGDKAKSPKLLYFGTQACVFCHTSGPPDKNGPLICRCTEVAIWQASDKHQKAYHVLLEDKAQRMGKLLGNKNVIDKATGCVACHGADIEGVEKDRIHSSFNLDKEGVSCAVCHGHFEDWVDMHGSFLKRDQWRNLNREEKQQIYGMTDLWDPAKRTELCLSCHYGKKNKEENKFVTHEMYAAGHPPLPGFDVATYSSFMPSHWQRLIDKPTEIKKLPAFHTDPAEHEQTRLVVVSGAVALREAMDLLAAQAGQCAKAKESETLDLANFDCYSCHHDLKLPSWRQERGYHGTPGRLQMRPWSTALIHLGLHHLGKHEEGGKELDQKLEALYKAFDSQPFGDCRAIASAADELGTWSKQLIEDLEDLKKPGYDQAAANKLLRKICGLALSRKQGEIPDYDTARELAWAFRIIQGEMEPKVPHDKDIDKVLTELEADLQLTIPVGLNKSVLEELGDNLKKLNNYDPKTFQKAFEQIAALLPPEEDKGK